MAHISTKESLQRITNDSESKQRVTLVDESSLRNPIFALKRLGVLRVRTFTKPRAIFEKTDVPFMDKQRTLSQVKQLYVTYTKTAPPKTLRKILHQRSETCDVIPHHLFPLCEHKLKYLNMSWKNNPCFEITHKIDGSKCSIIRYFQSVEKYCAGPKELYKTKTYKVADFNHNINDLLELLSDEKYKWIRGRVSFLWSTWMNGVTKFKRQRLRFYRKKVLVYLGSFFSLPRFLDVAGKGGPLGEIVQWTDLITALYILDYDVIISKDLHELSRIMEIKRSGCAPSYTGNNGGIDLIYTDINGAKSMIDYYGSSTIANFRCMLRVLDSFGTDPAFNFPRYPYKLPRGRSTWGNLNLKTTQFLTMFPHTQDNYFLGFIMPTITGKSVRKVNETRQKALVYAKLSSYIKGYEMFLQTLSEYFDIYATCVNQERAPLPSYIHNFGPVSFQRIQELLSESKLFIGVGFPYEGPGPLEAMANGAVFLQPKFKNPVSKLNNDFFKNKPNFRKLESQSPYMQEFIGEPYCFTINVFDEALLRKTLKQVQKMKRLPPKIPVEFSSTGYLKRVHVFTEYIDYCNPYQPRWPPENKLKIIMSIAGQSCKDACMQKGLVCEPTYFDLLNDLDTIERHSNLNCAVHRRKMVLHAPSIDAVTQECYVQAYERLFSCMSVRERIVRICPCRDYETEQTAICRNCL